MPAQLNVTRMVDAVVAAVDEPLGHLDKRLKDMEQRLQAAEIRLAEAEERGLGPYRGAWQASEIYKRGNMVSADGSMFVCTRANSGDKPGESHSWQLAVKRGRDARER